MGRLIYLMNVSLDGFVDTPDHSTDWATVDDELFTWFTDRARECQAKLYGRRLWDEMSGFWPTGGSHPDATDMTREFARIWNATPKVVFSSELETVGHGARLVRGDIGDELAALRTEFSGDMDVGGPTLAAQFIERGLVDVYRLVVHPVLIGAGTPFFPPLATPINLRLIELRTFAVGATYLAYETVR